MTQTIINNGDTGLAARTAINSNFTELYTNVNLKLNSSAVSAYALTLLNDADAPTARTTLGLGNLATLATVGSAEITDAAVTNAKLANVATATFKGRLTAGTGVVEDLTVAQATSLLNTFTTSLKGLTPASGGGTTTFLRADGTWAVPAGGGGGVTSVGGTGTVSGLTLTGTVTSTGNLTLGGTLAVVPSNFASQTANTFLAAPSGAAGVPTFRAIVAADIPTLNQSTTGSAATLTTSRNFSISGGGITASAVGFNGSAAVTLSASVDAGHITLARMANLAANSFIGNNTGAAATPIAMTGTQATALLDNFTSVAKGLAPASGGGTTNFLRADGTWVAPPTGAGTDLTYTASTRALASSTGTGFTFPIVTSTEAGLAPASAGGTANFLRADSSWASAVTSVGGTGTVSGLTLSGTVTGVGNLTLGGTLAVTPANFASQTANFVLAAPNGAAGVPTFRALVAADIPTLNQNTTGSAATLTTTRSITMSGDVSWTVNFNGSANATAAGTIANSAVSFAKIQNVTANSVLARAAATNGVVSEVAIGSSQLFGRGATGDLTPITLGTNLSMSGATLNAAAGGTGKQTIFIPASAMTSRITNGARIGSLETATNRINISTLDFHPTNQEFAQFQIAMPKSWDEGAVTYEVFWYHPAATTNFGVVWSLAGTALSDTNALDTAFGTAVLITDTGGATNTVYDSPESAAVTIGNIPAENDYVVFQIARVPADVGDTMAVDARLLGVRLFYTTNAGNDA